MVAYWKVISTLQLLEEPGHLRQRSAKTKRINLALSPLKFNSPYAKQHMISPPNIRGSIPFIPELVLLLSKL